MDQQKNPVAERAEKRRKGWETQRLAEVRERVEARILTEEEGRERGL
jgi:hypothetical protein